MARKPPAAVARAVRAARRMGREVMCRRVTKMKMIVIIIFFPESAGTLVSIGRRTVALRRQPAGWRGKPWQQIV
jgi:hypothetical protein